MTTRNKSEQSQNGEAKEFLGLLLNVIGLSSFKIDNCKSFYIQIKKHKLDNEGASIGFIRFYSKTSICFDDTILYGKRFWVKILYISLKKKILQ